MKLADVISIRTVLNNYVNERLSVPLSYKIAKFIRKSEDDAKFYAETLNNIIRDYSLKDADGNPCRTESGGVRVDPEKQGECAKAVQELEGHEVEPPKVGFTLEELAEIKLSPKEMVTLDPIIIEEQEG